MEDPSVMLGIVGCCLAMALAATVVGIPLTLIRRTSLERPLDALLDCCVTGLVVLLVGLTLLNWLGGAWFALIVVAFTGVIAATLRRQGFAGLPALGWSRPSGWTLATIVVLGGATLIRLRSVNYLSRGGDAGGYVNWANEYARTGVLDSGFPPLFSMYLGIASRSLGADDTTATVPLLGVLLLLATLRLLRQLEVRPVVVVAATLLVGLHTHAVWYSSFPMSEALQAPLLVVLLSTFVAIVQAPRDRQPVGELVMLGLLGLGLGLCRVTAPLLLVPMGALLVATLLPAWRRWSSPIALASAVYTAGVSLSYVYGITAIRPYYVGNQIGGTLPESVVSEMERFGLLEVTPVLVGLMVVGVAALAAIGWSLGPRSSWGDPSVVGGQDADGATGRADPTGAPDRSWVDRADRWWWPLPVAVALAIVGKLAVDHTAGNDVNGQLHRIGYPLLIAAGLALLVPRALRGPRALAAFFGAIVGVMMVLLNVRRFPGPLLHAHFLYWDRYLFSEMFPMVVVILALGATGLVEAVAARWPDTAAGRSSIPVLAVGLVPLLLAGLASWGTLETVRVMNAEETLDGTYELERDIVRLMPDADQPVLWTSNGPDAPAEFFFPNTWYALGIPLESSWGLDVVNIDEDTRAFDPEIRVSRRAVQRAVACSPDQRAYVVEIDTGGTPLPERLGGGRDLSGLIFTERGSAERVIPHLKQPRDHGWYYARVVADVYEVTPAPNQGLLCSTPG